MLEEVYTVCLDLSEGDLAWMAYIYINQNNMLNSDWFSLFIALLWVSGAILDLPWRNSIILSVNNSTSSILTQYLSWKTDNPL